MTTPRAAAPIAAFVPGRRGPVAAAVALSLALVAGCGNPRGTVPVEGRVTFGGQAPPHPGFLHFVPRGDEPAAAGRRPGTALFTADGAFKASCFEDGDGLIPGTYEVRITCEGPAAAAVKDRHMAGVRNFVPAEFRPADVTVPATGSRPFRVEIDVPTTRP